MKRHFTVWSPVLMGGRLSAGLSKEVSRTAREGGCHTRPVPITASLSDFSPQCASESSERQWEVSPAEGKPCQAQAQVPLSKTRALYPCNQVSYGAQNSPVFPGTIRLHRTFLTSCSKQCQVSLSACCVPGPPHEPSRQGPALVELTF